MNKDEYTYLLAHPQKTTKQQLGELATIIDAYPYFQSARAIQLKGYKDSDSFLYNDALKKTAAHTTDRDILFQYITSEKFVQHQISEAIQQHDEAILQIEVDSENLSEQVSVEIDRQLKAEIKKAEAILNPELFQKKATKAEEIHSEEIQTTKKTSSEDELQLNKPLEFDKTDTHSFSEWLKLSKAKPIDRDDENEEAEDFKKEDDLEKEKKFQLIEKFIQEKPKISPVEKISDTSNLAKPFTKTQESLMTETLAKVYLQQKNYKKAIQAYKILSLKNPDKSGFFADQIRAIEKLINNK